MSWPEFFDNDHSVYVNARHRLLHDRLVARDVAAFIPGPRASVLDFGCGEAREAASIARRCGRLILCDAAPGIRARLAARFADEPRICVMAPDEIETLADGSLDLVVANSLAQYLTRDALEEWLAVFRAKLRPEGRLVIGDVIPPDLSPVSDAAALLRFGFEGGFFLAALRGLARLALSDYRRLRAEIGLTAYGAQEMIAILERAGFEAARQPRNIGHNQDRMCFIAKPRA